MIRRFFTIVLGIAALLVAIFWIDTVHPLSSVYPFREFAPMGGGVTQIDNGQIRLSHRSTAPGNGKANYVTNSGEKLGFGYCYHRDSTRNASSLAIHRIWFPAWWALALLAAFPLMEMVLGIQRKLKRKAEHLCPHCEYSLIGLVSPRCPECGNEVAVPVGASENDYVDLSHHRRIRAAVRFAVLVLLLGGSAIMAVLIARSKSTAPTPAPPVPQVFVSSVSNVLESAVGAGSTQPTSSGIAPADINGLTANPVLYSDETVDLDMLDVQVDFGSFFPFFSMEDAPANDHGHEDGTGEAAPLSPTGDLSDDSSAPPP